VSISVPYLNRRIWSYTDKNFDTVPDYSFLVVEALTDVQGSSLPADAKYYMNVYRAAGSDYQLSMLTKTRNLTYPGPVPSVYKKQCSISQKFSEPFAGVTELNVGVQETGLLMADTSSTISDTCKRFIQSFYYSPLATRDYPGFPGAESSQTYTFNDMGPFHTWAYTFAYWRGSRRFKMTPRASNVLGITQFQKSGEVSELSGDPMFWTDYTNSAVCPWYCVESYYPSVLTSDSHWTYARPVKLSILNPADDSTYWTFLAAGDDFVFLYPIPPIVSSLLPPPGFHPRKRESDSAELINQTNNLTKSPTVVTTMQ